MQDSSYHTLRMCQNRRKQETRQRDCVDTLCFDTPQTCDKLHSIEKKKAQHSCTASLLAQKKEIE